MALIVETGAGLVDSESYASVAEADAYHANRGCTPWFDVSKMTTEIKEQCLRRATDYIEQVYGQSFHGYRVSSTQALAFPRVDVELNGYYIASDIIPTILKSATITLAYKAAQGNLAPDLGQTVKREKVDVLEVEYMDGASAVKRLREIDNILAPLLNGLPSGAMRKLVRV